MPVTPPVKLLALAALGLAACATGPRPDFEHYFATQYQGAENTRSPSHDEWMRLLASRYRCDTLAIRGSVKSYSQYGTGARPCDIASEIPPGVIRAWRTEKGLREEWRMGEGSRKSTLYLEGATAPTLLVTYIQWW